MYRDETNRSRMTLLNDMVRAMSRDPDPVRSINHYAASMRKLYGDTALISVSLRGVEAGCYRIARFLHQHGSGLEGTHDIVYAGPGAPVRCGGLIGEIINDDMPVVLRDVHVEDDPVLGNQLAPYRVLVAVPVFDNSVALNWVIHLSIHPDALSHRDIETRILQTNLMAGITNNKRAVLELRQATEWIQREVDEIALIQRGLLPARMPDIPGLLLAGSHRSFDRAGGDYYDVFPVACPSERPESHAGPWAMVIADVSGHGAAAAVIVAMMSTLLGTLAERICQPGKMLSQVNRHITAKAINGNFVTAFLLMYEPATRRAAYACAGHNIPLLRQADGTVQPLCPTEGIPLGVADDTVYENVALTIHPGQAILFYTDGITEAQSPDGGLFGEPALCQALSKSDGTPEGIIAAVTRNLQRHEAGRRQADDQAMLAIAAVE